MKKSPILFVLAFLLTVSCGETNKKNGKIPTVDISASSFPEKRIEIHDIADVEYLPLETTDEFLLANAEAAYMDDDYIVFTQRPGQSILFFDRKTGKGLKTINRQGRGEEEYNAVSVNSIFIDRNSNELYINNYADRSIIVYDLDGNFKRRLRYGREDYYVPVWSFDKDNFIVYDQNLKQDRFKLISKKDATVTKTFSIPVEQEVPISVTFTDPEGVPTKMDLFHAPLMRMQDGFSITNASSDTVFTINASNAELQPFFVRIPHPATGTYPTFAFPALEGGQYIFMEYFRNDIDPEGPLKMPEYKNIVYDRNDNKVYFAEVSDRNYDGWSHPLGGVRQLRDLPFGTNTITLQAVNLITANEEGKLHGELKEVADKLGEDDNPVLMILKFRD